MAEAVDRSDAASKGERAQSSALPVEHVAGARRVRPVSQTERQSCEPDWKIHGKQIWPGRNGKDRGGYAGANGGGNRDHHGIQSDAAAELRTRIDEAHQRGVDAHDASGAKSLHDPGDG